MFRGFLACAAGLLLPALAGETQPPVRIASPAVTEASGIAASIRHPDSWWVVNDSGSPPRLHLVGGDGADRGSVAIRQVRNRDWEDLASFSWKDQPYVLVADTGDNGANRKSCVLHIVPEPSVDKQGRLLAGNVAPAWSIGFRYDDGPRDCEAVTVDSQAGRILLLSKRTKPPVLYQLPLIPATRATQVAKRMVETRTDCPGGALMAFGNQPTGMDLTSDGRAAAISTYSGWFLVTRRDGETWRDAFLRGPVWRGPHGLPQAESIAFSKDSSTVILTSEGKHPEIRRFPVADD